MKTVTNVKNKIIMKKIDPPDPLFHRLDPFRDPLDPLFDPRDPLDPLFDPLFDPPDPRDPRDPFFDPRDPVDPLFDPFDPTLLWTIKNDLGQEGQKEGHEKSLVMKNHE